MTRLLLRLLLWLYYPFLALLCLMMGGLIYWLLTFVPRLSSLGFALLPVVGVLALTLWHVLAALPVLFADVTADDPLELRLPRQKLQGLYDLVAKVARERRLSAPQEIRLGADTVAHVFEEDDGTQVLVVGGLAIRAFTQDALAGIIAHELAHHAAGDTRLSRKALRRVLLMAMLDERFGSDWNTQLNPLVWLISLYHTIFRVVRAASSRQEEYAADRQEVAQAGKDVAAATLVRIMLAERLPYLRLYSVAQSLLDTGLPANQAFAEQELRAKSIGASEWQEAMEKELARATGIPDTHPGLQDRLRALDVTPQRALKLALKQSGPSARQLFADWDKIEQVLTERMMAILREAREAKREMAQIILGRPLKG